MKKALLLLCLSLGLVCPLGAQENISIATGAVVLRNLSPQQGFWAVGHVIDAEVHFSPTQSAYGWINYFTEGKFHNNVAAVAKASGTTPQQVSLTATGRLAYRQISLGWKHYFRGSYSAREKVNVYGLAGFGFLFGRLRNEFSVGIDTAKYAVPTVPGEGTLRKLTFDLGLGGELNLGGAIYGFADVRTWLPASSNTSPFLHNQKNVPLPVMVCAGIRVLLLEE